jgi:hypothetical protein
MGMTVRLYKPSIIMILCMDSSVKELHIAHSRPLNITTHLFRVMTNLNFKHPKISKTIICLKKEQFNLEYLYTLMYLF